MLHHFCFQYPKAFAASLLDYVGSQAQYLHTLLAMSQSTKVESQAHAERLRFAEMALEALRNVIKNNPGGIMHSPSCHANFSLSCFTARDSKCFSSFVSRFRVRVHRPFQTALLFVAGAWCWQSATAGVGGRDRSVTVSNLLSALRILLDVI